MFFLCYKKCKLKKLSKKLHCILLYYPFKRQPNKIFRHTQTIRQQFSGKLFEFFLLFCGVGAQRVIPINCSYIHEKCKLEYICLAYVGQILSRSKCYSAIFNSLFVLQSCFIYLEYNFHA